MRLAHKILYIAARVIAVPYLFFGAFWQVRVLLGIDPLNAGWALSQFVAITAFIALPRSLYLKPVVAKTLIALAIVAASFAVLVFAKRAIIFSSLLSMQNFMSVIFELGILGTMYAEIVQRSRTLPSNMSLQTGPTGSSRPLS